MKETIALGQLMHQLETREVLEQALDMKLALVVGNAVGNTGGGRAFQFQGGLGAWQGHFGL